MNVKRVVSGLVLFPVAAAILILGNKYEKERKERANMEKT